MAKIAAIQDQLGHTFAKTETCVEKIRSCHVPLFFLYLFHGHSFGHAPLVGLDIGALGTGKLTSLPQLERGRGARVNPASRFDQSQTIYLDDGWE